MIAEIFLLEKDLIVRPDVPASACCDKAATAENNDDDSDDDGGIVLFRLFSDGGQLIVHDFNSSYGMMDDGSIISGSLPIGASIEPVDDERCDHD